MGKEAKFGLAIILALLITFGVVLAQRMLTGDDEPAALAVKADAKPKATATEGKANPSSPADKPVVLAASAGTSKLPAGSYDPLQGWTPPALSTAAGQTGTSQSMMANPARPATAGDATPNDPFQRGAAAVGTAQVGQSDDTVRLLTRPTSARHPSGQQTLQTNQATAKAPLPGYGQTAAQQYSQPLRQGTPAQQVGTYGTAQRYATDYGATGYGATGYGAVAERTADGQYKVRPNESYWTISEAFYGTGAYFKALAEHNRSGVAQDDQLDFGDVISVPAIEELEEEYPGLCPKASRRETLRTRASAVSLSGAYRGGRTYVVEEGDTLSDIARYELGQLSRWPEILELNREIIGDDPNFLNAGMELTLPGAAPASPPDTITRRPSDTGTLQR